MNPDDLEYSKLITLLSPFGDSGRTESANFLAWFLVNIYRLEDVSADDAICDKPNDKGIDGIYVDQNSEEIHFFQSKLSQKTGTIGDNAIKHFMSSVTQLSTPDGVDIVLAGNANPELKKLINRIDLRGLLTKGYSPRGVFVANLEKDSNTKEIEKHFANLTVFSASEILRHHIDFNAAEGIKGTIRFDTSYAGHIALTANADTKAFLLPVSAVDLIRLDGIADGTLFSQNVRYSLGNTPVNKAIERSIADPKEHKNFTMYHNGVTLLCRSADYISSEEAISITDYVVVNGAQSITTFFHNASKISRDLRVFVKVISLQSQELSRKITINSNNQNAIKPRDLRSNHDIMLRLRAEFGGTNCGYEFEIKRGQPGTSGRSIISNEDAGRQLLAFDLGEPYSSHQIYRVFDDRYADIFGRPEVCFGRIIFLSELTVIITEALDGLDNRPMAKYGLTKYFLLNVVGHIIRMFDGGRQFLAVKDIINDGNKREEILRACREVVTGLMVDLSYEVEQAGEEFDYKRDLKSPEAVKEWRSKLLRTYEKDFKRGKAAGFGEHLSKGSAL